MAKSSKQSSGSAKKPINKYHSSPISGALGTAAVAKVVNKPGTLGTTEVTKGSNKPGVVSAVVSKSAAVLKSPTIKAVVESHLDIDSSDLEVSTTSNSEAKVYTMQTGIRNQSPIIVLASEFIPLKDSQQSKALSIKDTSKKINANIAKHVLGEEKEVIDKLLSTSRQIEQFATSENELLRSFSISVREALNALDITSFALPNLKGSDSVGSLYEILIKSGFSANDIVNFSETKVWMQSLVELKRLLLCHSPDLVMQKFPTVESTKSSGKLPYDLEYVTNPPSNLKRLWVNPYYTQLPSSGSITSNALLDRSIAAFVDFQKNQYVNLSFANTPSKKSSDPSAKGPSTEGVGKNSSKPVGSATLKTYSNTGRDISIIANCLFKEMNYSQAMSVLSFSSTLSQKFGYTVSNTGDNFSVWDYVIGRFPRSVLEFPDNPTGLGKSLVSFSQRKIPVGTDEFYHVLTFENGFLENANITPGSHYYIDSALKLIDGKNFDLSRLRLLISQTEQAHSTTALLIQMLGYDITPAKFTFQGVNEKYVKRDNELFTQESSLESVANYLSLVKEFYANVITFDPDVLGSTQNVGKLDDEKVFAGLNTGNTYLLTAEQNIATRLAALICKAAVEPTDFYKSRSSELRVTLFMLFMNIVMNQVDKVQNSQVITDLKTRLINQVFATKSGNTSQKSVSYGNSTDSEINLAHDEGRAFVSSVQYIAGGVAEVSLTDLQQGNSNIATTKFGASVPETYLNFWNTHVGTRFFDLEKVLNQGLWKRIVDLLRAVYQDNSNLFRGNYTGYSGMSKMAYLYSYFDMMLRVVAAQCPENIQEAYRKTYTITGTEQFLFTDPAITGDTNETATLTALTVEETGLMLDKVSSNTLNDYFDLNATAEDFKALFQGTENPIVVIPLVANRLNNAISYLEAEDRQVLRQISVFRKYFAVLLDRLNKFTFFLNQNLESRVKMIRSVLDQDSNLDERQKVMLLNSSLGDEQINLSRYILSEYTDRTNEFKSSLTRLMTFPGHLKNYGFNNPILLSMNELDHVSYDALKSYFNDAQFLKEQGFNKRILSIGIPPGMIRKLSTSARLTSDNIAGHRQRIIRMKVYKLDRLHPDVVYLPRTFLFDMTRFPTRILDNWHHEALKKNVSDLGTIPSKVLHPDGRITIEKDITQAFLTSDYGSFLDDDEKNQIYSNHSISFLCEEYLRWFTECRFEETSYYNYTPLGSAMSFSDMQYANFVNTIASKKIKSMPVDPSEPPFPKEVLPNEQSADVNYTLTLGGTTYEFAWKGAQNLSPFKIPSGKKFRIPLTETMKTYFANETFFLGESVLKKMALMPKKFDRVFSVIIDPDEFYVDESMTDPDVVSKLKQIGALSGGDLDNNPSTTLYKNRDKTPNDVALDEYFVTIEPFDYVEQQEV